MRGARTRALCAALLCCGLALALWAAPAQAAYPSRGNFGLNHFDVTFSEANGAPALAAGAHPFAMTTEFAANTEAGEGLPEGRLRDLVISQVPGLAGDTTAYPRCSTLEFLELDGFTGINSCEDDTAVGISASSVNGQWFSAPVFNIAPPPGVLLRFGFRAVALNVIIDVRLGTEPPYLPEVVSLNTPQLADFYANRTQIWGNPSDSRHDALRGVCGFRQQGELPLTDLEAFPFEASGAEGCPIGVPENRPLLSAPTDCSGPLATSYRAFSWEGEADSGFSLTHGETAAPRPFSGCDGLPAFDPEIDARPTSRAAESPTGLDFELSLDDPGLLSANEGARAKSDIREARVTLPEGMTANPSLAAGLEVCSEAQLGAERLGSAPGEGCPQASKIGAIEVDSPLVSETIHGSLYQAEPYRNLAGDSLIAFYIVLRNPRLGILVKQPVRVQADPDSGRLTAITTEIPQLPFSSFRLKFREGARSPLVSPPRCGSHQVRATIVPWSGGPAHEATSAFEIVSGPGGGPCPSGALPFEPGFEAGSADNAAAHYSPFSMRLTRRDGDQNLTRFDATLPAGVLARLAGVSECSDAQIARAEQKSGRAELASPSCPANSKIGSVSSGAGVGSQLIYVPGSLYLAGPFGGAPLSAVAIVPAVAGPFDVGTVVVRQALRVNPRSGVVSADGASSDPIPHILAGIPLRVRDVQVRVDRPDFTLNPTNCETERTAAQIWGGGENPFSALDDAPVAREARFKAADCASLGFAPRLSLRLRGGTRRGAFPALRAVYRPRPHHQANLRRLALAFPRSEFIEQGHFRTICTRVQFAAGAGFGSRCPKGSVYGRVRAWTPLLSEPLEGPVFLRSSNHNLPDAVFALHGLVDFEAVVRIDSVHGRLRTIVQGAPDAPISRVVVNMRGGAKGLFVNSRNLCASTNRARVALRAHNDRRRTFHPPVRALKCHKAKRKKNRRHRRAR